MDLIGARIWRRARWLSLRLGDGLRRALPGYCAFCLTPVRGGEAWCTACYRELPWNSRACRRCAEPLPGSPVNAVECGRCLKRLPAFDTAFVPLRYESHLTSLVHRFKFSADPRAGEVLMSLLATACRGEMSPLSETWRQAGAVSAPRPAIVGVPGQRERTRERGFDHVAWLARRLSERLALPVHSATRQRETPTQRGLDRRARRRNVGGAFLVQERLPPVVIVLDDVMTTGATLDSLAQACHAAGAERVVALACARTPSGRI
ncbi:ComF family protein [Salinicola halophilus]|uniref:ComF family protein n=1 Tax=Salinicola halophilus TaxID=184065 RepID=UPI001EF84CA4|nr:ComF family protein [Salinicola halophilus]